MKFSRNELCFCGSGKKYKYCCLNKKDSEYYEKLYNKSYLLMTEIDKYEGDKRKQVETEILSISQEIINTGEVFNFTGGAYVHFVNILYDKECCEVLWGTKTAFDKKIKDYLKKALTIKASNQAALSLLARVLFCERRYKEALKVMRKINFDSKNGEFILCFVGDENFNYISNHILQINNQEKELQQIQFYLGLVDILDSKNKIFILPVLVTLVVANEKGYADVYKILSEMKDKCLSNIYQRQILKLLIRLNGTLELENRKKGIEYCKEFLSNFGDDFWVKSKFGEYLLYEKQYRVAENVLLENLKEKPNNTDYYNLSKVYLEIKDFEKAKDNIEKALYFFDDELSFWVYGRVFRECKELEKAIVYQKKALYFLENENLTVANDKEESRGYSIVIGSLDGKFEVIYEELILTYIELKDFESAYAINKIALCKLGDTKKFRDFSVILDAFIDMDKRESIISKKLKLMNDEREKELKVSQQKTDELRSVMQELIKTQNLSSENKIALFEEKILSIVDNLEYKVNQKTNYKMIEHNMKLKYKNLSEQALKSLATGEYLYSQNQENIIDFAPIIISFCKGIEIEFNKKLGMKKMMTLGEIEVFICEKNRKWSELKEVLGRIRNYRNYAAHTGQSTKKRVEALREIIFDKDFLFKINELN